MAKIYKQKYFYNFRDITNQLYKVEIWQNVETTTPVTATEIKADSEPCTIDYVIDKLHSPVKASGAILNLLSTTDRMFFSLFTADMMGYKVKIYKGVNLFWVGFLDSENYSEPFNLINNYPVTITANDGFNLLDRIDYSYMTGSAVTKYNGVESFWYTLQVVLQKLNLDWINIYVGLSTTIPDVTILTAETVLHKLYLNNDNFYDEDGKPESCRRVLEAILEPLGAYIIQQDGSLIITDSHHITNAGSGLASFKRYTYAYEATAYSATVNLTVSLGDITTIGVQSGDSTFSIDSGYNRQVVSYSPYRQSDIIKYSASKEDFSTLLSTTTIGAVGYRWEEKLYDVSVNWNKYNNGKFATMVGLEPKTSGTKESYIKVNSYGLSGLYHNDMGGASAGTKSFTFKGNLPKIISSEDYFLKVDLDYFIRTTDNMGGEPEKNLNAGYLVSRLQVGDKKYVMGHNVFDFDTYGQVAEWVNVSDTRDMIIPLQNRGADLSLGAVNDNWLSLKIGYIVRYFEGIIYKTIADVKPLLIPLNGIFGDIEFTIFGYRVYNEEGAVYYKETLAKDLRIKNLNFSIVDKDGNELKNTDIEYEAVVNKQYQNEGDKVELILGTNINKFPVERGNILIKGTLPNSYNYLQQITKAGVTQQVENLLLRTINSNYAESKVVLDIDLPISKQVGYYSYANYLTGKKLMVMKNTMNLADNVSSLTLREANIDNAGLTFEG